MQTHWRKVESAYFVLENDLQLYRLSLSVSILAYIKWYMYVSHICVYVECV